MSAMRRGAALQIEWGPDGIDAFIATCITSLVLRGGAVVTKSDETFLGDPIQPMMPRIANTGGHNFQNSSKLWHLENSGGFLTTCRDM